MTAKIDVRDVVRDHYRSYYRNDTGGRSVADLVVFFAVPVAVAAGVAVTGVRLGETAGLMAGVSILGGFLFALLLLMLSASSDLAARVEAGGMDRRTPRRVRVLKEIAANVAYAVLAAIVATTLLVVGEFTSFRMPPEAQGIPGEIRQPGWFTFATVAMLLHLLGTLLMVLKRTYSLIYGELTKASVPPDR